MNNNDFAVPEELSREALLLGDDGVRRLMRSTVALFGVGGVGGSCAEALCRSGIGRLLIIDGDTVSRSNINRQLVATNDTIGMQKTDAMRRRLESIRPDMRVDCYPIFYDASTADSIPLDQCCCVIDAIDTVTSKLLLIERCTAIGVPVISCMGAGNKLDPSQFEITDIYKTSFCPLARVMRSELRKRCIEHLTVVYSREPALTPRTAAEAAPEGRRSIPGSAAFCVPAAGLLAASAAVKIILGE